MQIVEQFKHLLVYVAFMASVINGAYFRSLKQDERPASCSISYMNGGFKLRAKIGLFFGYNTNLFVKLPPVFLINRLLKAAKSNQKAVSPFGSYSKLNLASTFLDMIR